MREKDKVTSGTSSLSRRDLLLRIGGLGLWKIFDESGIFLLSAAAQEKPAGPHPSNAATGAAISPEDDQFLDELEKRTFQYFWEQAGPQSGLVRDRCNVLANDNSIVASIAATGFGLTALCIA